MYYIRRSDVVKLTGRGRGRGVAASEIGPTSTIREWVCERRSSGRSTRHLLPECPENSTFRISSLVNMSRMLLQRTASVRLEFRPNAIGVCLEPRRNPVAAGDPISLFGYLSELPCFLFQNKPLRRFEFHLGVRLGTCAAAFAGSAGFRFVGAFISPDDGRTSPADRTPELVLSPKPPAWSLQTS